MYIQFLYCISDTEKTVYYAGTEDEEQVKKLKAAMNKAGFSKLYFKQFSDKNQMDTWLTSEHSRFKDYQLKPFFTSQIMRPYLIGNLDDDPVLVSICKYCVRDLHKPPTRIEDVDISTILDNSCYFCRERRSELRPKQKVYKVS